MGPMKWAAIAALSLGASLRADGPPADRLYGRVITAGGETFEGYIRWDRNEGSWADVLNGDKEMPWQNLRDAERLDRDYRRDRNRDHRIDILGLHISWSDDNEHNYPESATSGIRMGHIRSLRVEGSDRARLTLKSGQEVEFSGGSTDIGDGLRKLVVEDPERGAVELRWRDLDEVDFMEAPRGREAPAAQRLWGTLRTREGDEFTGYIAWDTDEILGSDVLDGDEHGRGRKIPFDRIAAIERDGSEGARVVLENGEEITLRGSNDVDSSNRGIAVDDPTLGQVQVDWGDFDEVRFSDAPSKGLGYDDFDGGRHLEGTVETVDGREVRGAIRWDNDEEYSWEILDGRQGDVDFDIEFAQVRSIVPHDDWSADVTLRDGRTFRLEGSNDVDDDNKGIYVTPEGGETQLVRWRDLRQVTFR